MTFRRNSVKAIGTVESLWRYPIKSMGGESMTEVFMGFSGIYGDRCFAFKNSSARKGFPYLNATVQQQMLCYRPQFRYPERSAKPPNLIEMLSEGLRGENHLTLVRSDRALTDCRPVSLISLQTVRQLEAELGIPIDKRRFRTNIYLNLATDYGFAEDELVGRKLRIGSRAEIMVLERDPRCKMISLDPDTGEHNPEVLRKVAQAHATFAGVYCAVLVEGILKESDSIELLD